MARGLALVTVLVAGCTGGKSIDAARAASVFDRVTVDTGGVHGLSGLAVDGAGALWTVAERGRALFRVELDGLTVRSVTRFPVEIERGRDLEALAWSPAGGGDGTFHAGIEQRGGSAQVVRLVRDGEGFRADATVELTSAEVGVRIGHNHGVEGLCAAGELLVAAIETAGEDGAGRWAPLVLLDPQGGRRVRRLRLTTATGKLSALDCWPGADGGVEVVAIERHFEATRVLGFTLSPDAVPADLTPSVVLDLTPILRGALNLEGLVRLPDRRLVAVVDNQYGRVTGPDELLVFRPAPPRPAPPARPRLAAPPPAP